MFQACTEKITVHQLNLLKVQKNWLVILFQVDLTYISKSVKKTWTSSKKRSHKFCSKPQAEPIWSQQLTNHRRKQKLDKWQWKLKTSENPEQTGIYKSSIFSRKKVKQLLYYRRKYGESLEFKFRSYATGPCLDDTLLAISEESVMKTFGCID